MKIFNYFFLFILSFLIATETIFSGYKIGPVDIHRLVEVLMFLFLIKTFMKDLRNNDILSVYFVTIIIFMGLLFLKLIVLLFLKNDFETEILFDIIRMILMFIYSYLIYYLIKQNFKWLNYILFFNSFIFIIAFFQFHLFSFNDIFWDIKIDYFNKNTPDDLKLMTDKSRIMGLYPFAIPFIYALISNVFLTIYLYIKTNKSIYIYYFIFLSIVGILSLTRSFILTLAVLILYLTYLLIFKGSIVKKIFTIIACIVIMFLSINFYQEKTESISRITDTKDGSFNSRLPLAIMGLTIVYTHPFGATQKEILDIKKEIAREYNNPYVMRFPSHVGILELMNSYTILSLIVFIFFFYYLYKKCIKYLDYKLKYFFIFSFFAYLLNCSFHNMIIFGGDYYILVIITIIFYEYEQLKKRKNIEKN
jgi:hypothetical protein